MRVTYRRIWFVLLAVLVFAPLALFLCGCATSVPTVEIAQVSVPVSSRIEPEQLKRGQEIRPKIAIEISYQDGTGSETFITTASVQPGNGLRFVPGHGKAKVDDKKGSWAERSISMWPSEKRQVEFLLQVDPDVETGVYKIKIQVKRKVDSSVVKSDELFLIVNE